MLKKIKDNLTEKWVIENMTKVIIRIIIFLVFLFLFQQILWLINWYFDLSIPLGFNYISLSQLISFVGVTIAFWYGYKKYERDKELQILERYGKKYDEIKLFYKESEKNNANLDIYINKLFNLWREEYYLYTQKYINTNLWALWEKYILRELSKLITSTSKGEIDNSILIKQIINDEIVVQNKEFTDYLNSQYVEIYSKNNKIISYILKKFDFNSSGDLQNALDRESSEYFQDIIEDLNIEDTATIKHLERLGLNNLREILKIKLGESSFLKKLIINP